MREVNVPRSSALFSSRARPRYKFNGVIIFFRSRARNFRSAAARTSDSRDMARYIDGSVSHASVQTRRACRFTARRATCRSISIIRPGNDVSRARFPFCTSPAALPTSRKRECTRLYVAIISPIRIGLAGRVTSHTVRGPRTSSYFAEGMTNLSLLPGRKGEAEGLPRGTLHTQLEVT